MRSHRQQPTRLLCPWDSPGKNTGVGFHFLLQCMKVKSESEVAQSCPTLSDPMDCSLPGSSVHGIFQARVLEWGAIAFSEINITEFQKVEFFFVCSQNCAALTTVSVRTASSLPAKKPHTHWQSLFTLSHPLICFLLFLDLPVLGLSYKWDHTMTRLSLTGFFPRATW